MAKPELGTKRVCPACGTKYYDLDRDPITCPNCGVVFQVAVAVAHKPAPERVAAAVLAPEVAAEAVVERDEGVVSLEEAEADEADVGPDADEDEEPVIPDADIEVEEDIEAGEEDAFLPVEPEEGEDVADLLDVEGPEEDET